MLDYKNMKPLEGKISKSASEIGVIRDEKEREYSKLLDNLYTVEQEILLLSRDIINLQSKKKDLEITKSKASHIVRKAKIELDLLKNAFYSARNEGL